ncbi:MAG: S9 family peptidase, partial [Gemmatimonadaceae bacterium]
MRTLLLDVAAPLAVAAVVAAAPVAAQSASRTPHFPTNEDLRHTRGVDDPQLSPDGRFILATVVEPTADGAQRHFWLVDVQRGTSRQLTFSPAKSKTSETQGRWSADGKFVFFTARRGDETQLFKLPMEGGEAAPFDLTIAPTMDASRTPGATASSPETPARSAPSIDVSAYTLSPDGAYAAVVARDPTTAAERKQQADRSDATWVDHDAHGTRLYLLDLRSSALRPVAVPANVGQVAWSHASDRLLVVSRPMHGAGDLEPADTTWIVATATPSRPMRLATAPPTIGNAVWSADDAHIVFTAQAEADAPPGFEDLYVLTIASGAIRDLTRSFKGSIGSPLLDDGKGLIAASTRGTAGGYVRVDPAGALTPIDLGPGVVGQLATNERRTGWVYSRSSGSEPASLFYTPSLDTPGTRLSLPATTGDWLAVKPVVVSWKSDALTIEGLLYLPPEAATHRVPLVVNVHGGPAGVWRDNYQALSQFLIGQGWAVLEPNPRGSTGYGAAFA